MRIPAVRQCQRPTCRFRFPVVDPGSDHAFCPKCGSPTLRFENPYTSSTSPTKSETVQPANIHLEIALDNIRSTHNVGAIFRTADGAGAGHVHCCGITPTPDHPQVAKTALGAEFSVGWSQCWNILDMINEKRKQGFSIWALEAVPGAISLYDPHLALQSGAMVLLVVGNEVSGVDPAVTWAAERVIMLPMLGAKESLNVSIAAGVAIYNLCHGVKIIQPDAAGGK